jgi:hypothetical protein
MKTSCFNPRFAVLAMAGTFGAVGVLHVPAAARGTILDNFSSYAAGVQLNQNAAWANTSGVWICGLHNGVNNSPGVYWSGGGYASAQYATAQGLPESGQTLADSVDFNFTPSAYAPQGDQIFSTGFMYTPYPTNNYIFASVAVANTPSNEGLSLAIGSNTAYMGNAGWLAYNIPAAGAASNWFQLGLSMTKTTSGYNVGASLYDLGSNGTGTPVLLQSFSAPSQPAANLGINADSAFYAGFKYENVANEQLQGLNVDNFSLSQPATTLPEPSAGILATAGFALLLPAFKRRRI